MEKITVRPIQSDEVLDFAACHSDVLHRNDIKMYMENMFAKGSMRQDWCFVAERDNELLGRAALWTLPAAEIPLDLVLLELPWESGDYLSVGAELLRETLTAIRNMGVDKIGYVLDSPAVAPQWQRFPEQRIRFLEHAGFRLQRETYRFEWKAASADAPVSDDVVFRTFAEVGKESFLEAVMRVSQSSLDSRIQSERERDGAKVQAEEMYKDLEQMEYDPAWWQLAFTRNGELVGLVMPTKSPTYATIGYIGVVPEQRGRGYIDILLQQGTMILNQTGADVIRADTDVNNLPMANAFKRAGYESFARRREYSLTLSDFNL